MADTDEDALSWKGDSDPSLVTAPAAKPSTSSTKVDPDAASTGPVDSAGPVAKGTGSFLLVSYGILAGVYLIYTVGWILAIFRNRRTPSTSVLTEIMTSTGEYLAIASPALWFAGIFLLTRNSKPIIRLLWLLAGLALLIPWRFVLSGIK